MFVHLELIVIATVIAACQAFWWSSYPQTNSDENDLQGVRPIPFGYFRSYAYQPMIPYQYQSSYYPNYYNSYMTFPQLLTNIPSQKSQHIGKTSETINEMENFKSTMMASASSTTATTMNTVTSSPIESDAASILPDLQKIQISPENLVPNENIEPIRRMDQKYYDSFQRIPSWTFRHNAEQQPSIESQFKNADAKQKYRFVPCMCPISIGAPIPISIGATGATDRFVDNNIRRFEDLGEANIEDITETHL